MKKPFSNEEIKDIRALDFPRIANLPIMYEDEIAKIFKETLPRLLEIAEEHAAMSRAVQEQKTNAVQIPYSEPKVVALKAMLIHEERHIEILRKTAVTMQKQFDKKKEMLADVHIMIRRPWHYRFRRWIKEKALKVLP